MSAWEREGIADLVGSDVFLQVKDKPDLLKQVLELFKDGQLIGASSAQVEKSLRTYVASPSQQALDQQRKVLVADGMDLSPEALASELDYKELIDFCADVSTGGGNWQKVLGNPDTWNVIKAKGKKAGQDEIVRDVVGESFGVPPGALSDLTLKETLKGLEEASHRNLEGAFGKPEFWKDLGKGLPSGELYGKWQGVLEAEKQVQREQDFRELRQNAQRIRDQMARQAAEVARLRKERQEARRRKEAALKRRRAQRRRRRRRARAPKARVIIGEPEIVRVIGTNSVSFADGSRWDFVWYSNETESFKLTHADGRVYFWKGRQWLEQMGDNPYSPVVKRRRHTMKEWRRPAQSSQQAAGPLGRGD